MSERITMYGATHCEDTIRTRARLNFLHTPFQEVNIDNDPIAEAFVRFINDGKRSTPTLVVGSGNWKIIITEPTNQEVDELVRRAGYTSA
jgi:glutaredoxin